VLEEWEMVSEYRPTRMRENDFLSGRSEERKRISDRVIRQAG